MKTYVNFQIEELMVSKLQLFLIYSIFYILLNSHKKFHVGEELTKTVFFLFGYKITLYMLNNFLKH